MNGLNISPNTHVQIDRSLRPTGRIRQTLKKASMNYFALLNLGIFTGHRGNKITGYEGQEGEGAGDARKFSCKGKSFEYCGSHL